MTYDFYCALCGGPLLECKIAEKSRGAALRNATEEDKVALEEEFRNDEDYRGYDPEIVDKETTGWTSDFQVLGFNADVEWTHNAYLSGPATIIDDGEVQFHGTNDEEDEPTFPDEQWGPCYIDCENANTDRFLYPFHGCCYELLVKVINGAEDSTKIDKDQLYLSMQGSVDAGGRQNRLCLNYGDPDPPSDQGWESKSGEEYFVAHPMERIDSTFVLPNNLKTSSSSHDLGPHVRYDPFATIPPEIIYQIVYSLPPSSLIALMEASWTINIAFRQGSSFWFGYLKRNMPWFFELHENLESIGPHTMEMLHGTDIKGLFIWADNITKPRRGLSGWRMGLANRRRIWNACEGLKETYVSKLSKMGQELELEFIERKIREQSNCRAIPLVSYPLGTRVQHEICASGAIADNITTYWIRSWSDLSMENVFDVYWDADGSMTRISFTTDGENRQFGESNCDAGFSKESLIIDESDWITGIILHIPRADLCDYTRGSAWTSVKGLTVLHESGKESYLGNTDKSNMKRPLLVSPEEGSYIVGLRGQSGPSPAMTDSEQTGKTTINRIGLLQARRPSPDDYSFIDENEDYAMDFPESEQDFEKYIWRDDCSSIFGRPIWEQPLLRQPDKPEVVSDFVHPDMIPHEALVWAKDTNELQNLKRISAYIIPGDHRQIERNGAEITWRNPQLCGLRAEFHNGGPPRTIGASDDEGRTGERKGNYEHFEIDGPGGEFVNEVFIDGYSALRLCTNRDREIAWAPPKENEHKYTTWTLLDKGEGETAVGVLMTFAKGGNWVDSKTFYQNTSSTSIAALFMPFDDN